MKKEEVIKFKGNNQFLKLQKYLIKSGRRFNSGRVYNSLDEFKLKNMSGKGNEGFFVIKYNTFICNISNISNISKYLAYDSYKTYEDIFCMLDIE